MMATRAAPHGRRYPWEEWFGRDRFVLRRGRDYDCRTPSMVQIVWQAAGRHGVKPSIVVAADEQSLDVRILKRS